MCVRVTHFIKYVPKIVHKLHVDTRARTSVCFRVTAKMRRVVLLVERSPVIVAKTLIFIRSLCARVVPVKATDATRIHICMRAVMLCVRVRTCCGPYIVGHSQHKFWDVTVPAMPSAPTRLLRSPVTRRRRHRCAPS